MVGLKRGFLQLLGAVALALCIVSAWGQIYPAKPVRMVVGFPAGGGVDLVARAVAQRLSDQWGHPVIVDNRTGANGTIATDFVAKSPPDGHTVLMAFSSHTINAALYEKLPFETMRDFSPVTLIATVPNILVLHPSLPVRNVKDLIALASARPGQINYASAGSGSPAHMSAELFKQLTGINMTHVAYKGGPPSLVSVISGETSLTFTTILLALPHVRSGRMRAVAVTGLKPSPVLRDVPPVADSIPGYESFAWYGILVPAGTPRVVSEKLHGDTVRVARSADMQELLQQQGAESLAGSSAQFAALIADEIGRWRKLVVATGMKAD